MANFVDNQTVLDAATMKTINNSNGLRVYNGVFGASGANATISSFLNSTNYFNEGEFAIDKNGQIGRLGQIGSTTVPVTTSGYPKISGVLTQQDENIDGVKTFVENPLLASTNASGLPEAFTINADVVHNTGNETITGTKTFSNAPSFPNGFTSANLVNCNFANANIENVNRLSFQDAGVNEGLEWKGGSGSKNWKIFDSPDTMTNAAGNLQIVKAAPQASGSTAVAVAAADRIATFNVDGNMTLWKGAFYENGVRVYSPNNPPPLYTERGSHADGAMTQKAVTDALTEKMSNNLGSALAGQVLVVGPTGNVTTTDTIGTGGGSGGGGNLLSFTTNGFPTIATTAGVVITNGVPSKHIPWRITMATDTHYVFIPFSDSVNITLPTGVTYAAKRIEVYAPSISSVKTLIAL